MLSKPLIGAAAFGVFTAISLAFGAAEAAMPVPVAPSAESQIVQVWGGCGPYGHRGPWGGCRPGGQWNYRPYYGPRPYYYRPRPYYRPRYWGPRRRYW
jgi:hypothetical protein